MNKMKIKELSSPLYLSNGGFWLNSTFPPSFCYNCGECINNLEVYYLFEGIVFCCRNCVEDYVKHFYEEGVLMFPWALDDDIYKQWKSLRGTYEHPFSR